MTLKIIRSVTDSARHTGAVCTKRLSRSRPGVSILHCALQIFSYSNAQIGELEFNERNPSAQSTKSVEEVFYKKIGRVVVDCDLVVGLRDHTTLGW
jgi:hypothetical protein